jgi:hypothetical protein
MTTRIEHSRLPVAMAAVFFLSVAAWAGDTACQPGLDAAIKLLTVPVHVHTIETLHGGKSKTSEGIYMNGAIYINVNGKWIHSKMTTADMLKQEQENIQNSKMTCHYVQDEAVNGEAAAIYAVHSENQDVKADAQTWISKSKKVPLRTEEDLDTGYGDKQHISIRYEYGNVQAPAGMQ